MFSPGSRSTPLAVALAEETRIPYTTHFDERGLGFYALGLSKGYGQPVGIIVTSGTAVGNLLPAIMEAWHDHVPLILLTADRPPELRDCGANQTTDQVKIFSSFVHWQIDLPCPFPQGERYLASTMAYGVHNATEGRGPVHFNCMFREPLLSNREPLPPIQPIRYYPGLLKTNTAAASLLATELAGHEKGVIVCGQNSENLAATSILALAERLQWPVLADIASGQRGQACSSAISYYDFLLKDASDLQPTAILHFGGRLVSKTLMDWCHRANPSIYAHVDEKSGRLDPQHAYTHHFKMNSSDLCTALLEDVPHHSSSWLSEWQSKSKRVEETLQSILPSIGACSEPGLMQIVRDNITLEHALFLSNSMPVRDANLFLFPIQKIGPIFTNRGLSGIDGNIATIAGIAAGSQKPTIAIIGDLTALHDLNSLALVQKSRIPILLIVVNNAGGAIFSFLPHLANTPQFEELFAHNHEWAFAAPAAMFSLPYSTPSNAQDLASAIRAFCKEPSTCVIELRTERKSNYLLHKEIEIEVAKMLNTALV